MHCPDCDHQNPEEAKFCIECGCHIVEPSDKAEAALQAESERKHVTIMFSDLSGYTAMNEKLDPEEVKEVMSQIFGEITQIIKKYDGFIERFIGDAVMAVFGIPQAHEDDSVRSVRAAMEILAAVERISPQFEEKIGRPLTMHIGINTGLVVTGEVNVQKGTHGLTGDAINLASRLEGIAGAGEIVVGPDTYNQAANWFEFEALEPTQVKGKTDPVAIYRVVSIVEQQATRRRQHGVQAELVGRDAEMAMLMEAVENLKQRRGSVISIAGHAGTGKSRLIQEFKDQLPSGEIQWHEGHAYAYAQNMAYYPLINLLTNAFQIKEEDGQEQIREKVETGVDTLLWDKPEAKQYLGSLFSLDYDEIEEVSPEFWRSQLHQSVQQLLEAVAGRGPTVMLFEDLHWADSSFIELLHLLMQNTQRPVLFVCVYRPSFTLFQDGEPDSLTWPHHKIELKELSWDEIGAMLQSLLNTPQLPDELRYFIKQKVEGNPFYLEEVINTLIETETLVSDNGGWQLTKSLDLADIPTTVQGMLTARLDRLEKQAKRILQEASVIGRAFFYKVLTRITKLTVPVDRYLSGLENLDLIRTRTREPDLEYIFKHALTQEVVYNGLLKKERQAIHERIGTAIEQIFSDRLPEFYETLAFHFTRGQSAAKAVDYLVKSGEKSLARYAVEETHQHFKEAYGILVSREELSETEKTILIDLLNSWGHAYYFLGAIDEFIDLFKKHRPLADDLDDKARVGMFYVWFGIAHFMGGKPKDGYDYLGKSLKLGEQAGNQKVIGYACTWLTWACAELGLFSKGLDFGERAQEISLSFPSDQYLFFKSIGGICFIHYFKGDVNSIFGGAKRLLEYGENNANSRSKAFGHWMGAFGYSSLGDMKAAQESCKEAIEVALDPAYPEFARLTLGLVYFFDGLLEEAEQTLELNLDFTEKYGMGQIATVAQLALSPVLIAKGHMKQGAALLEKSRQTLLENRRKVWYALSEHILGEVNLQIATGPKPALATMAKNIGFLVKSVPFAAKKAEEHFNRAIELFKEIGANGYLGQSYLSLGLLHRSKKRNSIAKDHLRKAIEIFEGIEAEENLKMAEDALNSLG